MRTIYINRSLYSLNKLIDVSMSLRLNLYKSKTELFLCLRYGDDFLSCHKKHTQLFILLTHAPIRANFHGSCLCFISC